MLPPRACMQQAFNQSELGILMPTILANYSSDAYHDPFQKAVAMYVSFAPFVPLSAT